MCCSSAISRADATCELPLGATSDVLCGMSSLTSRIESTVLQAATGHETRTSLATVVKTRSLMHVRQNLWSHSSRMNNSRTATNFRHNGQETAVMAAESSSLSTSPKRARLLPVDDVDDVATAVTPTSSSSSADRSPASTAMFRASVSSRHELTCLSSAARIERNSTQRPSRNDFTTTSQPRKQRPQNNTAAFRTTISHKWDFRRANWAPRRHCFSRRCVCSQNL